MIKLWQFNIAEHTLINKETFILVISKIQDYATSLHIYFTQYRLYSFNIIILM